MHAVFIMYGLHNLVEFAKEDLTHTKFPLKCWKVKEDGTREEMPYIILQCQFRQLPFGLCEFIFPREFQDQVLNGLKFYEKDGGHANFDINQEFSIMGFKIKPIEYVKKALKIDDIPEKKSEQRYPFFLDNVSVIPIGVRYDPDIVEHEGMPAAGQWHEAI